jgi:NAD(P)H-hydrate epimerase
MAELVLTRDQVRDVDRRAWEDYGLSTLVLMENAGRGAAEFLVRQQVRGPVVICAGKGNNGGDGFVIARWLDALGLPVRVLLFAEPGELSGDAAANYRVLERAGLAGLVFGAGASRQTIAQELSHAEVIVDALLGTGTRGTVREPYLAAIEAINASARRVLAVDLPSGMDCDTGAPLGACVRATWTMTFVARKVGFDAPQAAQFTGEVHVAPIGVPRKLIGQM